MRVLRSKDWVLLGMIANCLSIGGKPAFLFQHRAYGDVLVLNEAKYIDVESNNVFFCDAKSSKKIYASHSNKNDDSDVLVRDLRQCCAEIGI